MHQCELVLLVEDTGVGFAVNSISAGRSECSIHYFLRSALKMVQKRNLSNRKDVGFVLLVSLISVTFQIFSFAAVAEPNFSNLIEPASDEINQGNDCAGTLRRYFFPAVGYKAKGQSKESRRGHLLYDQLNCAQCHAVNGIGAELGPPLDGIGGYRGKTWLIAHLSDPDRVYKTFPTVLRNRSNIMPHPGVTVREAVEISEYLLTLAEPKKGFSITHHSVKKSEKRPNKHWSPQVMSQASHRGKELFFGLGCAACHSLDGSKDRFGPDLAGLGARLGGSDLEQILAGSVTSSIMRKQSKGLSPTEVKDIQAYLLTLP